MFYLNGGLPLKPVVLKENHDFRRLYSRGKYIVGSTLVTYCTKGKGNAVRYGITAGKKVGGAVERNRSKRVIREAFRALYPEITGSYDLVFVARTRTASVNMNDVAREMRRQLLKLNVICE